MEERYWLIASTFCFFLGLAYTLVAIGAQRFRPTRFNLLVLSLGFLFQTIFLHQRGQIIGRCPLTNLFEVLTFLSWSIVLIYLVVGPTYRMSLMGGFTAPLVFLIQGIALALPIDHPHSQISPRPPVDAWLEMHAALAVISYGAFALAAIAGLMYLVQDFQLKRHQIHPIFYLVPPIHELALVNRRLLLLGTVLLATALGCGFAVEQPIDWIKVTWSAGIWIIYALLLVAGWFGALGPKRIAAGSTGAFLITFASLFALRFFTP